MDDLRVKVFGVWGSPWIIGQVQMETEEFVKLKYPGKVILVPLGSGGLIPSVLQLLPPKGIMQNCRELHENFVIVRSKIAFEGEATSEMLKLYSQYVDSLIENITNLTLMRSDIIIPRRGINNVD